MAGILTKRLCEVKKEILERYGFERVTSERRLRRFFKS
jgi:hypothetical protein